MLLQLLGLKMCRGENVGSSAWGWLDVFLVSVSEKFGYALVHVALKRGAETFILISFRVCGTLKDSDSCSCFSQSMTFLLTAAVLFCLVLIAKLWHVDKLNRVSGQHSLLNIAEPLVILSGQNKDEVLETLFPVFG